MISNGAIRQKSPLLASPMLSFPVVFVSSARESDRNRINMAKRGGDFSIQDSNSDQEEPTEKIGRKYDGAAKYRVKYNPSWAKEYPVKAVDNDRYSFFCIPCGKSVSCHHQGLRDVKVHCERDTHRRRVEEEKKSHSIRRFLSKPVNSGTNVIKAEVIITNFLVQHNLPIAAADHLGPLLKEIFPDSKICSGLCLRTHENFSNIKRCPGSPLPQLFSGSLQTPSLQSGYRWLK